MTLSFTISTLQRVDLLEHLDKRGGPVQELDKQAGFDDLGHIGHEALGGACLENRRSSTGYLQDLCWVELAFRCTHELLPCELVPETLRCHFQDVAEAYPFQVKPWGYRPAVWWWLGHIERSTEIDDDGRRVCSLRTLMRALDHHQMAVCDFMRLHPLSTGWARRHPHEDRLLAMADFILHLLWKHCSTVSSAPASFPFFSLVCKKRRPKIFTGSTFTGLQHADHIIDWEIEWTDEGMAGYSYWQKRQSALVAMEPLMVRLIADDHQIVKLEDDEETGDNQGPQRQTLVPAGRPRSTRTTSAATTTSTSSTNVGDQPAAARVIPRRGRPRPPHADEEQLEASDPEPKRRRQLTTATPPQLSDRRHIDAFPSPQPPLHEPVQSPAPGGAVTTTTEAGLSWAEASVGRCAAVEGEREKAEMRLLDAKERKIAAHRLLIQAQEDVRKARAHLLSLPSSL